MRCGLRRLAVNAASVSVSVISVYPVDIVRSTFEELILCRFRFSSRQI